MICTRDSILRIRFFRARFESHTQLKFAYAKPRTTSAPESRTQTFLNAMPVASRYCGHQANLFGNFQGWFMSNNSAITWFYEHIGVANIFPKQLFLKVKVWAYFGGLKDFRILNIAPICTQFQIFKNIFRIGKILYIPGCPSVGRYVRPSIEIQSFEASDLKLGG